MFTVIGADNAENTIQIWKIGEYETLDLAYQAMLEKLAEECSYHLEGSDYADEELLEMIKKNKSINDCYYTKSDYECTLDRGDWIIKLQIVE